MPGFNCSNISLSISLPCCISILYTIGAFKSGVAHPYKIKIKNKKNNRIENKGLFAKIHNIPCEY